MQHCSHAGHERLSAVHDSWTYKVLSLFESVNDSIGLMLNRRALSMALSWHFMGFISGISGFIRQHSAFHK